MKKRISPTLMSPEEFMKQSYLQGKISEEDYDKFTVNASRRGVEWAPSEDFFVTAAATKAYSPEFIGRILGRTAPSVRQRIKSIFGHSRRFEIASMSPQSKIALLNNYDEDLKISDDLDEIVSDSELLQFLADLGFDGVIATNTGA